jgi:hypothetical protein
VAVADEWTEEALARAGRIAGGWREGEESHLVVAHARGTRTTLVAVRLSKTSSWASIVILAERGDGSTWVAGGSMLDLTEPEVRLVGSVREAEAAGPVHHYTVVRLPGLRAARAQLGASGWHEAAGQGDWLALVDEAAELDERWTVQVDCGDGWSEL